MSMLRVSARLYGEGSLEHLKHERTFASMLLKRDDAMWRSEVESTLKRLLPAFERLCGPESAEVGSVLLDLHVLYADMGQQATALPFVEVPRTRREMVSPRTRCCCAHASRRLQSITAALSIPATRMVP